MILIFKVNRTFKFIILFICLDLIFPNIYISQVYAENLYISEKGYKSDYIYINNVPIDIYITYSYEEKREEGGSSIKEKIVTGVDSVSVSCKDSNYGGFLYTSSNYTSNSIRVNIYGTLKCKSDSNKNIIVNEDYSFNI